MKQHVASLLLVVFLLLFRLCAAIALSVLSGSSERCACVATAEAEAEAAASKHHSVKRTADSSTAALARHVDASHAAATAVAVPVHQRHQQLLD